MEVTHHIDSTLERHNTEIGTIKEHLSDISTSLKLLLNEQKHFSDKFDEMKKNFTQLEVNLASTRDKLQLIETYNQFKQQMMEGILKWIKIGAIVFPLVLGAITYVAYDIGLYKQVPHQREG